MLVGLLKLRRQDGGTFGLVRLLWNQVSRGFHWSF